VARQGAKVVDEEQLSGKKAPAFRGTGYRLGETPNDTVKIEDTEISTTPTDVRHKLTFWANGFCVDDGPLRDGSSDKDQAFIESISKGYCVLCL
jgi:UBX domain-containing protein 1